MVFNASRFIKGINQGVIIKKSSVTVRFIHYQQSFKRINSKAKTFSNLFIRNHNANYLTNAQMFNVKQYSTQKFENVHNNKELGRRDIGLTSFMSTVYTKTLFGVLSTIGTSLLASQLCLSSPMAYFASFGIGMICGIGGSMGVTSYQPEHRTHELNGEVIHYTENTPMREASYWIMTVGMGLTVSPLVTVAMMYDPAILPLSLLISTSVLGGCAMYASTCKDATMMQWKAPLAIGLSSLVSVQLIGIGSTFLFGPNILSSLIYNTDIYGGVGLFTAMSIYDAYMARKMYLSGQADHLLCSVHIYLDFLNLWIRIMQIILKERNKSRNDRY